MSEEVTSESVETLERAAKALWRLGNKRIGHREWETVSAAYVAEAAACLEASGLRVKLTEAEHQLEELLGAVEDAQQADMEVANRIGSEANWDRIFVALCDTAARIRKERDG